MNQTVAIAPVRKTIHVKASTAHAFEVFTAGLDRWWPKDHGIGKTPRKAVAMETRLGGHWYELAEDGTQTNVGRIVVWEPPQRFGRWPRSSARPTRTSTGAGTPMGSKGIRSPSSGVSSASPMRSTP